MVPSELRLTQKWDYAVETFLTRSAIGLVTAGLFSIVLFKGRCARLSFSTFGLGVGVGDAFRVANTAFEKEKEKKADK